MKSIFAVLSILIIFQFSSAGELQVDTTRHNSIVFYASSTLGSFRGTTSRIRGEIYPPAAGPGATDIHPADSLEGGIMAGDSISFSVDLRTIDTGIGLRNKHMRGKYLQTDRYPRAVYRGRLAKWTVQNDSVFEAESVGLMSIHGAQKTLKTTATLYRHGKDYRVVTSFKLDIDDFNIKQPRFLFTTMGKEVALRLIFYLTTINHGQ